MGDAARELADRLEFLCLVKLGQCLLAFAGTLRHKALELFAGPGQDVSGLVLTAPGV